LGGSQPKDRNLPVEGESREGLILRWKSLMTQKEVRKLAAPTQQPKKKIQFQRANENDGRMRNPVRGDQEKSVLKSKNSRWG